MNNLTQSQIDTKQADLNKQQEKMLFLYHNADEAERKAIIRHIDFFFGNSVKEEEKIFWFSFRMRLEKPAKKSSPLFSLGEVYLTNGAREALEKSNQLPSSFLEMHQTGNWGIVQRSDWQENDLSVKEGFRILSAYKTNKRIKIWIITEADRSSTTILLPSEY